MVPLSVLGHCKVHLSSILVISVEQHQFFLPSILLLLLVNYSHLFSLRLLRAEVFLTAATFESELVIALHLETQDMLPHLMRLLILHTIP